MILKLGFFVVVVLLSIALLGSADEMAPSDYRMTRNIQGDDTWGYNYKFSFNDPCAYSWVKFAGEIYNSHEVMWKWYSPDGELYSTNSVIQDVPIGGYYEWISTWACLPIRGNMPINLAGKWRVDIYLDGQKKLTEDFNIVNETLNDNPNVFWGID